MTKQGSDKEIVAQNAENIATIAAEVDHLSRNPTDEDLASLKRSFEELEEGLPPATSGEVLSSRCVW